VLILIDKGQEIKAENKQVLFFPDPTFGSTKANTAAIVSLFEIPRCFADVLWLKAKVDGCLFREEKEQTYVWNPLLLLFGVDDYG
jgi:hypothetical protein